MGKIKINIYQTKTEILNELIQEGAVETTENAEELLVDEETYNDLLNDEEGSESKSVDKQEESQTEQEAKPKKKLDPSASAYIKPDEYDFVKANLEVGNIPLLVGQAGIGKTEMCIQLAKDLGLEFYTESSVVDQYTLKGFTQPNGVFKETYFFKAFTKGGLFLMDELDNCDPSVLVSINTALANKVFAFDNGVFKMNDNFKFIATANTYGDGASFDYVGRNQLDKATLDRFVAITCKPCLKVEKKLTKDKDLLCFLRDMRKVCNSLENHVIISYRTFNKINSLLKYNKFDLAEILKSCIFPNLEKEDIKQIFCNMKVEDNDYYKALAKLGGVS